MLDLVEMHDGIPMVSSLDLAERFGRRHADIIKTIEALEISDKFRERNFSLSSYESGNRNGRQLPMYWMTRDGWSLLVMGFTGRPAMEWKERYIEAFSLLEKTVREVDNRLPAVPRDYQTLIEIIEAFGRDQEAKVELERHKGKILMDERRALLDRLRQAERVRDASLSKVDAVSRHAYKALMEIQALYESSQSDLMSKGDAENVMRLPFGDIK